MHCTIVPNWETHLLSCLTACLDHAPKKCTQWGNFQFDIKSSSDFKILSARKLKTLFQKYKLQLTTGIQAGKVNSYFFQSRSWLFQLAYFVKCKWTLLELNFCHLYPSSRREWILSLLFYVLRKTWNQAFSLVVVQLTAKKCTKKRDARAKLLFCLVKLLLIWLSVAAES